MSPPVEIKSSHIVQPKGQPEGTAADLDTPDELCLRSLILGIVHRTLEEFGPARELLWDAHRRHAEAESKWMGGVALFELAVLDLREAELKSSGVSSSSGEEKSIVIGPDTEDEVNWAEVMKKASEKLEKAMAISGNNVDLSSRLDSRVNMLRDEIAMKKELLNMSK